MRLQPKPCLLVGASQLSTSNMLILVASADCTMQCGVPMCVWRRYVEQTDLHMPEATVREGLLVSD